MLCFLILPNEKKEEEEEEEEKESRFARSSRRQMSGSKFSQAIFIIELYTQSSTMESKHEKRSFILEILFDWLASIHILSCDVNTNLNYPPPGLHLILS